MDHLEKNYFSIAQRITSALSQRNSRPHPLTWIVVSKGRTLSEILTLYQLGHRDFGESYVQELASKAHQIRQLGLTDLCWHFLGHIQTNKIKKLWPLADALHGLDSVRLIQSLTRYGLTQSSQQKQMPVWIQVNLHGETSKSGVQPLELGPLVEAAAQSPVLLLQGLMCIPDPNRPAEESCIQLRELEKQYQPQTRGMLSMGMSQDFEEAILQGATHIRIGRSLFSPAQ